MHAQTNTFGILQGSSEMFAFLQGEHLEYEFLKKRDACSAVREVKVELITHACREMANHLKKNGRRKQDRFAP